LHGVIPDINTGPICVLKGGNTIEIIPSIDLRNGKCVRLYQGDYNRETIFDENPLEVSLRWQVMGAPRIHIVDLDGAATGEVRNLEIIEAIATVALVPTQLGGGIRDLETVEKLLKAGIERVVLGTAAVEDRQLVEKICRRFGESVIVSIDARQGRVATRGWVQDTPIKAIDFARDMVKLGVKRFIYTDINRDGTLTEPNFTAIMELMEAVKKPVIAAGGVSSLTHIKILKRLGVEGAIIGRALYTGDIDLKQALAEAV
jgi:phosphoribosylformimino-5-aminoimidazole carboxamide ribotide isomerase